MYFFKLVIIFIRFFQKIVIKIIINFGQVERKR